MHKWGPFMTKILLLSLLVMFAGVYTMYGAEKSSSSPFVPPAIPLEHRDTVMGRDFDMIMDVEYLKTDQFLDKTVSSTAFITTSNGKMTSSTA